MDTNTPNDEDAGMQAGFDSTDEGGQSDTSGSSSTETATDALPAGQQGIAPPVATESSPSAEAATDPFAGLPPQVRELLAKVPTLESQLAAAQESSRRAEGQVRSLQGRFDRLSEAPAQPAPRPAERTLDKLQHAKATLGHDMPEVMDALEELAGLLPPTQSAPPVVTAPAAPAPAPAQVTVQQAAPVANPHLQALDAVRPDWFDVLDSADCKLWLTTQSTDLQATYRRLGSAGDALKVIGAFDKHRQNLQTANPQATRAATQAAMHASRVAAAVVPTGHARAPAGKRALTEEEAMEQGFRS